MDNLILKTDSYISSHYLQYPEGMTYLHAYIESRGGKYGYTKFFGLQYYLKRYLTQRVTMDMVEEAQEIFSAHGLPFNYAGWSYVAKNLKGKLPIKIRAVPEGTIVPNHNVLVTIESTDEKVPWIAAWFETLLLKIWYPVTVSTLSHRIRIIIKDFMNQTSDTPEDIDFKLHDFGYRASTSEESAGIGGLAHLINFKGTDTVQALLCARNYYNEPMAGFSIPASAHSTMTSWGREHEADAYRNMVETFSKPGSVYAVVSDSYDIFHAVDKLWGEELRELVIEKGGTLVVRPDSGGPVTVVLRVARLLEKNFGATTNDKGYKVLNHVRIIQGDGIHEDIIYDILKALRDDGFSADNIAFGMGGALLQGNKDSPINRDANSFALKTSYVIVNGEGRDVAKDPVTDKAKHSKKGQLELILDDGNIRTVRREDAGGYIPLLRTVFENGELLVDETLGRIRAR